MDSQMKLRELKQLIRKEVESAIHNSCPICSEPFISQCKCAGIVKHTQDHLKKGHGKVCKNGHRWSAQTIDGNTIVLGESKIWPGAAPERDDFNGTINREFIDGMTKMGYTAIMNPENFRRFGKGKGDRYRKSGSAWIKIPL